jgi:hypothetical protein
MNLPPGPSYFGFKTVILLGFLLLLMGIDRITYGFLLKDSDVKNWHDNVARGSRVTADVYPTRLGAFCGAHKKAPEKLISLTDDALHNLLLDFVSLAGRKGYAGSCVHLMLEPHHRLECNYIRVEKLYSLNFLQLL